MIFRVLPQADQEASAAATWYQDREAGLGYDFFNEWARVQDFIRRNPGGPPVFEHYSGPHEVRRCLFQRFHYSAIYLCQPEEISVIAVAHTSRRPLYWLDRLPPG
jgi:hypothetical protein